MLGEWGERDIGDGVGVGGGGLCTCAGELFGVWQTTAVVDVVVLLRRAVQIVVTLMVVVVG